MERRTQAIEEHSDPDAKYCGTPYPLIPTEWTTMSLYKRWIEHWRGKNASLEGRDPSRSQNNLNNFPNLIVIACTNAVRFLRHLRRPESETLITGLYEIDRIIWDSLTTMIWKHSYIEFSRVGITKKASDKVTLPPLLRYDDEKCQSTDCWITRLTVEIVL